MPKHRKEPKGRKKTLKYNKKKKNILGVDNPLKVCFNIQLHLIYNQVAQLKTSSCFKTSLIALSQHKSTKLPSVHVLGDFNFREIDWPDRLSKSGTMLSQSEGQILLDIMNEHGQEQMVSFPTRDENTLDLIITSLPGQFEDVYSPDKLSNHDIVSGSLKIYIPPARKPRIKVYS